MQGAGDTVGFLLLFFFFSESLGPVLTLIHKKSGFEFYKTDKKTQNNTAKGK